MNSEKEILNFAIESQKKGNEIEALKYFQEALILNPKSVDAYFNVGNLFLNKGEIGKAIKAFSKILEIDPCHTEASISLSVIYNDIGKYDEAKKIFENASERVRNQTTGEAIGDTHLSKKFAHKHFEIAEQYFTYGRYDDALFEYNKAASLDPSNEEIRLKIAKTFAKKGFVQKALEELKKLKAEKPHYFPARLALGLIHYGSGDVVSAQQEWMKILSLDPNNSEAKTYLSLSENATETTLN